MYVDSMPTCDITKRCSVGNEHQWAEHGALREPQDVPLMSCRALYILTSVSKIRFKPFMGSSSYSKTIFETCQHDSVVDRVKRSILSHCCFSAHMDGYFQIGSKVLVLCQLSKHDCVLLK